MLSQGCTEQNKVTTLTMSKAFRTWTIKISQVFQERKEPNYTFSLTHKYSARQSAEKRRSMTGVIIRVHPWTSVFCYLSLSHFFNCIFTLCLQRNHKDVKTWSPNVKCVYVFVCVRVYTQHLIYTWIQYFFSYQMNCTVTWPVLMLMSCLFLELTFILGVRVVAKYEFILSSPAI